jgi:hypothetical protein
VRRRIEKAYAVTAGNWLGWLPRCCYKAGADRRSRYKKLARAGTRIPANQARWRLPAKGSGFHSTLTLISINQRFTSSGFAIISASDVEKGFAFFAFFCGKSIFQ